MKIRWAGRDLEGLWDQLGEVRVETEGELFGQRVAEGQGVRSPSDVAWLGPERRFLVTNLVLPLMC